MLSVPFTGGLVESRQTDALMWRSLCAASGRVGRSARGWRWGMAALTMDSFRPAYRNNP